MGQFAPCSTRRLGPYPPGRTRRNVGFESQCTPARHFDRVTPGGLGKGREPRSSVVDEAGRHHQLANLSVHDASIFPTSVAANPQLSIYAITARLATALARTLRPA